MNHKDKSYKRGHCCINCTSCLRTQTKGETYCEYGHVGEWRELVKFTSDLSMSIEEYARNMLKLIEWENKHSVVEYGMCSHFELHDVPFFPHVKEKKMEIRG